MSTTENIPSPGQLALFELPDRFDAARWVDEAVNRIARVRFEMEEAAFTREVITVLQDKGYVVREAEDFEATLAAERERVLTARRRAIQEGDCICDDCIREALEVSP